MLDVDNFKHFNDTWGHPAGDVVLQDLGSFLLRNIRGEDIASRYGGDEFIIVLPDSSQSVTLERARLISAFSEQLHFKMEDQVMDPVSFSIGVATYPADGFSSISLMRAVDAALYRAKARRPRPSDISRLIYNSHGLFYLIASINISFLNPR